MVTRKPRRARFAVLGVVCAFAALVGAPVDEAEGAKGPCPAGMAHVTAKTSFCIDKWEASLVGLAGGREVPHSPYEQVKGEKLMAV